jgi:hypothetical protein
MPILPRLPSYISVPPLTNDEMLDLGEAIYETFFGAQSLDWPTGTDLKAEATNQLTGLGYDRVEWAQADDDCLLLLLWYTVTRDGSITRHHWIMEFAGDIVISAFRFAGERVL